MRSQYRRQGRKTIIISDAKILAGLGLELGQVHPGIGQPVHEPGDDGVPAFAHQAGAAEVAVITSYSIHYTKLYDHLDRWVTVEGVVTEEDDELRIKVRSYTLEDELDYESDEDW